MRQKEKNEFERSGESEILGGGIHAEPCPGQIHGHGAFEYTAYSCLQG